MEPSHDHIEKTLDKLVASTRSPRGRYSASESWKLLERQLVPPRTKRLRLFRLAGAVAASLLLCFASWFIYDYWKPVAMQTVSAGAAISVITLPDQTKVTLNRYSSLTYPDRFKEDRREVQLQGEAYFEVAKNAQIPFVVTTSAGIDVKVLGTKFNVASYENDEQVTTTLAEGSVEVGDEKGSVRLKPEEQALFCKGDRSLRVQKVDVGMYLAWKDGKFIFEEQSLEQIMKQLQRWYEMSVFYTNEEVKQYTFSGDLKKYDDFDKIIRMLEEVSGIKISIKENCVVIGTK